MKVVINARYGGFGLSDAAHEKLIEWGVPVRAYVENLRDPDTGLYLPQPLNDGEVIFDRTLTPKDCFSDAKSIEFLGRYWTSSWLRDNRTHPLLVRVVEELGEKANGKCSALKIVEIPDDIQYEIEEYDGMEWVAEKHRKWD